MSRHTCIKLIKFNIIILYCLFYSKFIFANTDCPSPVGKVVSTQGVVTIADQAATLDDEICPGIAISTGQNSRTVVRIYKQNTLLRLNQNTTFVIEPDNSDGTIVELFQGIIHIFSRVPKTLKVKTPFVNATIEGTEFVIKVDQKESNIVVYEGQVKLENQFGELTLNPGEAAFAELNQPPTRRTIVRPLEEVNWALYYPPTIDDDVELNPQIKLASNLISAGQADEARIILSEVIRSQPNNEVALSLLSMIEVTQNQTEKARELANSAVQVGQTSISYIASSYVNQAQLDLDKASDDAKKAVELNPSDVFSLLRLAEIQVATGNSASAYDTAQKAIELAPENSRAHTTLGFSLLEQYKLTKALEVLKRAVALDPTDPQARLGLGLAEIRNNQLDRAIEQLEIALSLSPSEALIRSILGNSYLDGKKYEDAAEQFSVAKQLDPNGPTPYLYNAINLQTQNRHVEALKEINKSIELNDNRAVLRVPNLLDQDSSARITRQGRIYRDLGFEQLALIEGWKAIQADQANHAGHRFLADVYGALPRHELARDSELLQAELLQPAIVNSVQPNLSSNGLSFLNDTSFIEFGANDVTRSFQSNGFNLKLDALTGSNSTYANNTTVTGNQDNFSFSLGQFHYETNGIRENNDEERDIYAGLAQYNLTPDTSLFFELREEKSDGGEIPILFDPNLFSPNFRENTTNKDKRISFNHKLNSDSFLLGTYFQRKQVINTDISFNEFLLDTRENNKLFELRYLRTDQKINLTYGVGHIDDDFQTTLFDSNGIILSTVTEFQHSNAYSYADLNLTDHFILSLGLSVDRFKNKINNYKTDKLNPKFGATWNLSENSTLRAAAFRTLNRTISSGRTLERTNIAGFNQFFEEPNITDTYHFGIGIDNKREKKYFSGAEFRFSSSKVPFGIEEADVTEVDQDETYLHSYFLWIIADNLVLKSSINYQKFDADENLIMSRFSMPETTYSINLGTRFFDSSGWIAGVDANLVKQRTRFVTERFSDSLISGEDKFLVIDGFIGYRFNKYFNGLISLELKNILDDSFMYQSVDPRNSDLSHERELLMKLKIEF